VVNVHRSGDAFRSFQHDAELKSEQHVDDEHDHPRLVEGVLDSLVEGHA
jgi:hypothetical protein